MGNTIGKSSQNIRDQYFSCSNRRKRKKELAKLSNGEFGISPGTGSVQSPVNNVASYTKQEESVSLLSHRTCQAAADADVKECQKPKETVEENFLKKDMDLRVEQCPKMRVTPPPPPSSPSQHGSLSTLKPAEQVFQEKVKETLQLKKSNIEARENAVGQTYNKNSKSICGSDAIQEKINVKNVDQQNLHENLDKDSKTTDFLKHKQADPLKELESRQDAIFARLHKIQNELDNMSKSSDNKMDTTEHTSNWPSVKIAYQDLVVGVDPTYVPLSLLVLYEQLSQMFKVKISVFVHSTVKKSPSPILQSLLQSALPARRPDDCRTTNDFLLTFIYKQVRQDCSLMVNPEQQTYIYGEVNVARYLSRLADPDYDSDPVTSTQVDHWLDLASLMLWNGSGKASSQMVQNIDSALVKRKWLVGQNLSLADIIVWSGLHYAKMMSKLPSNVQVWRKNCENHPYFKLVTQIYK